MILKSANERGFTLIELLAVMTVMALLAVLLVPRLSGMQTGRPALAEARLLADLRAAAATAQREGRIVTPTLPAGAVWQPGYPAATEAPRFFADGSAHGGTVSLGDGRVISVGWLDGRVEVRNDRIAR